MKYFILFYVLFLPYFLFAQINVYNTSVTKQQNNLYTVPTRDYSILSDAIDRMNENVEHGKEKYMEHYNLALQELAKESPNYNLAAANLRMCLNIYQNTYYIFKENTPFLYDRLSFCYKQLGDKEHEIEILRKSFEFCKTEESARSLLSQVYDESAMLHLASLYMKEGNFEKAKTSLDTILSKNNTPNKNIAKAYGYKAELFMNKSDFQKAICYSDSAILIDPYEVSYWLQKCQSLYMLGLYEPCIKDLSFVIKSIQINQTSMERSELYLLRGQSYIKIEKLKLAKKDIRKSNRLGNNKALLLLRSIE